jgi:cytohesin
MLADRDPDNKDGITPLHLAAHDGLERVVEYLVRKEKREVNALTSNAETPLHFGAASGNVNIIRTLLNGGSNVNAVDRDGVSALHKASATGQIKVALELLKAGANVNAKDRFDSMGQMC